MACDLRVRHRRGRNLSPSQGGWDRQDVGDASDRRLCERARSCTAPSFWGLVTRVVAGRELLGQITSHAKHLARGTTQAYRLVRKTVYSHWEVNVKEALENERRSRNLPIATDDIREGIAEFWGKRVPAFKGG